MGAGKKKASQSQAQRGKGKPFKKGDKRAGRPKGVPNRVTTEVKEAAQALVESGVYRANLQSRLDAGELAPAVETMLWHYAYGKPKEKVELTGPNGGPVGGTGSPSIVLYMPDNGRAIVAPTAERSDPPAAATTTTESKPP